MLGLAIDSADQVATAALWRASIDLGSDRERITSVDGGIDLIEQGELPPELGKADQLITVIEELLRNQDLGYADLDIIAVNRGPGSFTGLRSAVALVRGLSLAAKRPVLAVTGHEALLAKCVIEGAGRSLMVVQDARRGEVYAKAFEADGRPLSAIRACAPAAVAADLKVGSWALFGSGAELVSGLLSSTADVRLIETGMIDAWAVARAAATRLAKGEMPVRGFELRPLYIREPDAVPPAPLMSATKPPRAQI